MTRFDLHMHSGYSPDGQFTPAELVAMLKEKNIEVAALCDHDRTLGVKEMMECGKKEGIRIIPALECSTKLGEYEVHVLGLGIDPDHEYFQGLAAHIQSRNSNKFHRRVELLRAKYNLEIDEEEILKEARGSNPWFTMMNKIFNDPRYQTIEDFKDYIPGGKRSDPAPVNFYWDKCQPGSDLYISSYYPDFKDTIQKIHEAGGLAVIAHPFRIFYQQQERLAYAIECGIDGIEAYSNYHEPFHNAWYEQFAREHDLLITCGSDFHGEKKPSIQMGEYGLDRDGDEFLDAFLEALQKKTHQSF